MRASERQQCHAVRWGEGSTLIICSFVCACAALETELFQGRIMLKGGSSDGKEVMLDYELFSKVNKQRAGGTGA